MARFLCFRLHGPLASWGDVAVGERRPSAVHPSRSGILGLVAGSLGLRRDDEEGLAALDALVGVASRTDADGGLLVDFHTAQGPSEKLLRAEERSARKAGVPWHRPATRRAEVDHPRAELETLLSQRQYRVDALWTVALWQREAAPGRWTLEQLAQALTRPVFVPYLGRKSCPVDLPLEPQVVEAGDPAQAMALASFTSDDLVAPVLGTRRTAESIQWEGDWPGLLPEQTSRRRDRVISRSRWQFTERTEHQAAWRGGAGGRNVPEQG